MPTKDVTHPDNREHAKHALKTLVGSSVALSVLLFICLLMFFGSGWNTPRYYKCAGCAAVPLLLRWRISRGGACPAAGPGHSRAATTVPSFSAPLCRACRNIKFGVLDMDGGPLVSATVRAVLASGALPYSFTYVDPATTSPEQFRQSVDAGAFNGGFVVSAGASAAAAAALADPQLPYYPTQAVTFFYDESRSGPTARAWSCRAHACGTLICCTEPRVWWSGSDGGEVLREHPLGRAD